MKFHLPLFFLILLIGFNCNNPNPTPTNVVLIIVDDLGSGDLGCYGSSDILTPNIDKLASEGILFSQAYSGCTVCAPARSTLITGQHMGHTPVRGNTGGIPLPEGSNSLGNFFKEAGYATGGFGKWGIGEIGTEGVAENHGFDVFFGYYHQIHAHSYYVNYLYENSEKVPMDAIPNDSASYTGYRIVAEMKKFIIDNKNNPFFCYAPWPLPHGKYEIPEIDPAVKLYEDKDWSEKRKNYAAMSTLVDRQVGEIMDLLIDLNLEKNTLVLFCSDNGADREFRQYNPNGSLNGFKRDLTEGGIRIPLIAWQPNIIEADIQTSQPVYFPDFFPTFAEAISKEDLMPDNIDGISFYKIMSGEKEKLKERKMYWEYPHYNWGLKTYTKNRFAQAVRFNEWKMIKTGDTSSWELYNLEIDPSEKDNIAAQNQNIVLELSDWVESNRHEMHEQVEPARVDGKPFR
jgi:arylsulfatase A-like enzyme